MVKVKFYTVRGKVEGKGGEADIYFEDILSTSKLRAESSALSRAIRELDWISGSWVKLPKVEINSKIMEKYKI